MNDIFASSSLDYVLSTFASQLQGKINFFFEDSEELLFTVVIDRGVYTVNGVPHTEAHVIGLLEYHDKADGDFGINW